MIFSGVATIRADPWEIVNSIMYTVVRPGPATSTAARRAGCRRSLPEERSGASNGGDHRCYTVEIYPAIDKPHIVLLVRAQADLLTRQHEERSTNTFTISEDPPHLASSKP